MNAEQENRGQTTVLWVSKPWPVPYFLMDLLRGYAWVLLVDRPAAGLVFLLATMLSPMAGVTGLLSALTGAAAARLLALPAHLTPLAICNSLLVGLSLGVVRPLDAPLAAMVLVAATAAAWLTMTLHAWLWRLDRLPALSGAFVGVALVAGMAVGDPTTPRLQTDPDLARLFGAPWDHLLTAFGSAFFTPYPLAGLGVLAALFWASPFLAMAASAGFALGHALFLLWAGVGTDTAARWGGFNFVLTAIALSGVFVVPSARAFALAMTGVALSALLAVAGLNLFLAHGLPVLALPFLLSTWLVLAVLRHRVSTTPPEAALERPGPPEALWERARLARARGVGLASVPLAAPFFGQWRVAQGFDGPHTHQGPWRHALDFDIPTDTPGAALADYPCFGAPVLSPAHGLVVGGRDDLPDNPPGEMNLAENWGNHLLIRIAPGRCVLLAHLKQGSLRVRPGEAVVPGQPVAACGNSGRSATPHLHLHVQEGESLGSPTAPFHLVGVNEGEGTHRCFRLTAQPSEGTRIEAPVIQGTLAHALSLPAGREMIWRWRVDEKDWRTRTLQTQLSLLGRRSIVCGKASIAYEETPGLLALFDREGPADECFDLWCLGLGLTPFPENVIQWTDAPPARLFPLPRWRREWLRLRHPLGAALESRYRRRWDEANLVWLQTGEHRCPGVRATLVTEAALSPSGGCVWMTATLGTRRWRGELIELNHGKESLT